VAPTQDVLAAANAAEMCIDLVAKGLDREVVFESVQGMDGQSETGRTRSMAYISSEPRSRLNQGAGYMRERVRKVETRPWCLPSGFWAQEFLSYRT
jgi:hypothetical protein